MAVDRLGALRSKIELTLHTHHAARIWKGRGVETGRPQIIGMRQFLLICGAIKQNAAKDDPYADHWLLQLDAKLADTRAQLDQRLQELDSLMAQLPPELDVEENLNQQPLKIPVYTGGQHGWLALRLLIDFDRFVRRVMLAHHIALIGRRQMEEYVRVGGHLLRSLCASTQKYPGFSGATRDDFAANNAKARNAIEKFGALPDDVLSGKHRSEFAPPITKPAEVKAASGGSESESDQAPSAEASRMGPRGDSTGIT